MLTEKLAKGILADATDLIPAAPVHRAFVRLLQSLKQRRDVRPAVGFRDSASYRRFIDSLLDTASQIENLAPSAAGIAKPNAEYPWLDVAGSGVAPCDHAFDVLDPRNRSMVKLGGPAAVPTPGLDLTDGNGISTSPVTTMLRREPVRLDLIRRICVAPVRARIEKRVAAQHVLPLDLRITDPGAHDLAVTHF